MEVAVGADLFDLIPFVKSKDCLLYTSLGWFVLSSTGQEKHTALLFILQNCAANLCGMITPFGNPQNLYLFSLSLIHI